MTKTKEEYLAEIKSGGHSEDFGKVCLQFGFLDGANELNFESGSLDWEDIVNFLQDITAGWASYEDIQDEEEKGYIMAYARRKIYEKYGT